MAFWFKHWSDFRHKPAMITLLQEGTERDALAFYRLLEVVSEVCGEKTGHEPVLELVPPLTELWLANELFTAKWNADNQEMDSPGYTDLKDFLALAHRCGAIELERFKSDTWTQPNPAKPDGPRIPLVFQRIRIIGFDKMLSDYTLRAQRNSEKHGSKVNQN
jgi:hypothetical protein